MYFDTTAFESTHAIAKYALTQQDNLQASPWYDKNTGLTYEHSGVSRGKALGFMKKEILANVAARGYLETSYYQLGSDIRQGSNSSYLLSYMTQMGGWPLLDAGLGAQVGLQDALALGYASYLAGWADVNASDAASRYGAGAFRSARTVIFRDSEFGWIADGGILREAHGAWQLHCHDGLNQRIDVLEGRNKLSFTLDRDGFAPHEQQSLNKDLSAFQFQRENRTGDEHRTLLRLAGPPRQRLRGPCKRPCHARSAGGRGCRPLSHRSSFR